MVATRQEVAALIGKLASRRTPARLGFPVTATTLRDAGFAGARADGGSIVALTAARKARSRLIGKIPQACADHRLRPVQPRDSPRPIPALPRAFGGPSGCTYNPKRDVYILSRYSDVREAARNHDVLSSARGVTISLAVAAFLPTSPIRLRTLGCASYWRRVWRAGRWSPRVRWSNQLAGELVAGLLAQTPRGHRLHRRRTDADAHHHQCSRRAGPDRGHFPPLVQPGGSVSPMLNLSVSGLVSLVRELHRILATCARFFTHRRRTTEQLGKCTVLGSLRRTPSMVGSAMTNCSFSRCCCWSPAMRATANMIGTCFSRWPTDPDQLRLACAATRSDPVGRSRSNFGFMSPVQTSAVHAHRLSRWQRRHPGRLLRAAGVGCGES